MKQSGLSLLGRVMEVIQYPEKLHSQLYENICVKVKLRLQQDRVRHGVIPRLREAP